MSPRRRRNTLSRTAVLDATLALIDRVGVDGLTVRGLAHALGRPPMSLYAHFDSKATLLDLAFGHLVHRLLRAHRHATWQAELEAACRHMRHELIRHPHWVGLLTRVSVPPSALHGYDRLLGLMAQDGLRPEAAMFALSSIVAHALGAVLTERLLDGTPPVPAQRFRLVRAMIAQLPRGAFPRIDAVSPRFERWTFERVFEVGLRSLVRGLDQSAPRRRRGRPAGPRSAPARLIPRSAVRSAQFPTR
jgi:TetR/AcrR family tetracycline transcriptional repressor